MSRSDRIDWWLAETQSAVRTVAAAREARRPSALEEEHRSRAGRVEVARSQPSSHRVLRGTTITGGVDEERRRSLPLSKGGGGAARAGLGGPALRDLPVEGGFSGGAGQGGALGRARKLAAGYQPAVIKVVSYARGVARATATGQYIQREEVALETHDGRMLEDREAVAEEMKAWSTGFAKRAESQDVVALRLRLAGARDTLEGRELMGTALAAGFSGHRYAARIDVMPSGELEACAVVAMAGGGKERFRVREERVEDDEASTMRRRFDMASTAAITTRIEAATGQGADAVVLTPGGTSHGRDGVTYRLNKLVESGAAIDDRGRPVANVADTRSAAREWGRSLRSQSSRDTMHLIISAKAGTDVAALTSAARAFLHDRFADHKFMFGVHTDKEADGHIHAHAVVTVKNEAGQKIHPSRDTFRDWREAYAEHAQEQGLKIVATSARERASSQSYGPRDKAIVDVAERPRPAREARDRGYASHPDNRRLIENARHRISTARDNPIRLPASEAARQAVDEGVASWRAVVREQPDNDVAEGMLARLTMAQTVGAILHKIGTRVDHLMKERNDMAITSEKMVKDLRLMNEAVSRTSDLLEGQTKRQFQEASARYLETLANRVDLQRLQESGVETMTRAEIQAIAGPNADRLIAHAQQIQGREIREAATAERLTDRTVETERRQEARAGADPDSVHELRAERAMVSASEQSAARESREAVAASDVVRALTTHPGRPLPVDLGQTEALAKLRAEQERVIQEIEAEAADPESAKPQRMS
ncbi:relaxase/mobilization nuclease domain-containing protein [Lichenifustis flavocetrariae]|uniref:Relaxase/mobilization nuclease domain-containing protein n=1 Tax=Lichenifustis flavocetrariae TaxID=2949735 RepID=A0AA41ZAL0_9HYPH|nr:relaxase/mobilization nuclease domain-containing protein [Lichenifustis flavocetrariae]MCW6512357.1 relaxase/mobilization nuclease domain-containing protein [Lichenifustis flavocetrariae]